MPRGASQKPPPKSDVCDSGNLNIAQWESLTQAVPLAPKRIIDLDTVFDTSVDSIDSEHISLSNEDGLDEGSFRHFGPLLSASQEYAWHTGFRFRGGSFDGIEDLAASLAESGDGNGEDPQQGASSASRLAAKIQAKPAIKSFADRLMKGEPELVEELDRAFRIIVAESARNMMIATVKGLGLFPPSPSPEGISDEDCSYEDASAPLPVIGQRLYNDHVRRRLDECSSAKRRQRRSMTAAFLVDFAYEAGVALPQIPETYQTLQQEFAARYADFNAQDPPEFSSNTENVSPEEEVQEADKMSIPEKAENEQTGWLQRWHTSLWAQAGAEAVSEAQKAPKRRARPTGCV
jgi:hypothetical protein